jgi:hypothetical protein
MLEVKCINILFLEKCCKQNFQLEIEHNRPGCVHGNEGVKVHGDEE